MSASESEQADGSTDIEQIIVYYAGYAAQSKSDEHADKSESRSDAEYAAYLLQFHTETESSLRLRARKIVDENWAIIKAIADKLYQYGTLEAEEWSSIVDAFDDGENPEVSFVKARANLAAFAPSTLRTIKTT